MAKPETIPGCPPGLEYLTQIDQLLVHQQIELLEGLKHLPTSFIWQDILTIIKDILKGICEDIFEILDICEDI